MHPMPNHSRVALPNFWNVVPNPVTLRKFRRSMEMPKQVGNDLYFSTGCNIKCAWSKCSEKQKATPWGGFSIVSFASLFDQFYLLLFSIHFGQQHIHAFCKWLHQVGREHIAALLYLHCLASYHLAFTIYHH